MGRRPLDPHQGIAMEPQGVSGRLVDPHLEHVLHSVLSYPHLYCGKKCEAFIKVDFHFMEEKL